AAVASGPNSYAFAQGGFPAWTNRRLEEGDFFHLDSFGFVNGYQYDFGRGLVVGGRPSPDQRLVLEAAIEAVQRTIEAIRPGARANELYEIAHNYLTDQEMTGDGTPEGTPALF